MSVWRRRDEKCKREQGTTWRVQQRPALGSKESAQALLKPGTSCLQEGMRVVWEEIRALGFSPVAKPNSVS